MPGRAPRPPLRPRPRPARGALPVLCLWLAALALWPGQISAQTPLQTRSVCTTAPKGPIAKACYRNVTGTAPYGHGVLGATPEWEVLTIYPRSGDFTDRPPTYLLPRHIFEDIAPRLIDLDRDGAPEVITVQSAYDRGARLAVFSLSDAGDRITLRAATPYIGTRNRWLAPVGAADLDGDGHIEIAYIDRPHLAKTLRVWRYRDGALHAVAALRGLSNHRIGEDFISGGIRDCGTGPEVITADANWQNLMATRLEQGSLTSRKIANRTDQGAFDAALNCR